MIVEACETLFTPACVYNNTKDDADAGVLKELDEPAWNNPVVRLMTHDRKSLAPRISSRWTKLALLEGMVHALGKHGAEVPRWLRLLLDEERPTATTVETAIFGMG